jgi:hypothetical protein
MRAIMRDDAASMYAVSRRALPSWMSHRISHPIPSYAVGCDGMNGRQISQEMFDFSNGAIQKRTS